MANAYVVGTFDTKGDELRYVADLIQAAGVATVTVDLSTGGGQTRAFKAVTFQVSSIQEVGE